MQILIIEDEAKIAHILRRGFLEERYNVDIAKDGREALEKATVNTYDIIILDLMIPLIDGITVCKSIREKDANIPILILTAKDDVRDKIEGLDVGADDYVTKPFSIDEIVARVRALLRRGKNADSPILSVADLQLNPAAKTVTRNGHSISLTAREYTLLEYLMRHPDRVLSKSQIIDNVWDYSFEGLSNVVETYIRYLRKKLKITTDSKELIHTVRGLGYIMRI